MFNETKTKKKSKIKRKLPKTTNHIFENEKYINCSYSFRRQIEPYAERNENQASDYEKRNNGSRRQDRLPSGQTLLLECRI